jgi:hypothetical protein
MLLAVRLVTSVQQAHVQQHQQQLHMEGLGHTLLDWGAAHASIAQQQQQQPQQQQPQQQQPQQQQQQQQHDSSRTASSGQHGSSTAPTAAAQQQTLGVSGATAAALTAAAQQQDHMLVLPLAHAQQAQRSGRVAAGHPGALPHRAASATPPPPGNSTAAAASGPGAAPAPAPAPAIALFVGVLSAPGNRTARDAIRATWGADARLARVLFVALGGHTAPEQVALLAEAARHRDMVVVSDVPNSYHNPTHALVALFRAAAAAADRATHVLKTDDDSYVRVPALLDTLAALPRTWLYAGRVERTPVRRRPGDRWEVPRANWPSDAPITYTWGMASILSMDLVTLLAAGGVHLSMPPANMLWIEDMAVGVWVADLARVRGVAVKVRPLASISAERCRDRDVVTANLPHPVGPSMRCLHALGGRCCSANLTALCCS